MEDLLDSARLRINDFRYGFTIVGLLTLGLLLLVFGDLSPALQNHLVPSVAVYTIGTGVIAGIQTLVTTSANTKALAKAKLREQRGEEGAGTDGTDQIQPPLEETVPCGIPEPWLHAILILHSTWFLLLVGYNIWKAVL